MLCYIGVIMPRKRMYNNDAEKQLAYRYRRDGIPYYIKDGKVLIKYKKFQLNINNDNKYKKMLRNERIKSQQNVTIQKRNITKRRMLDLWAKAERLRFFTKAERSYLLDVIEEFL